MKHEARSVKERSREQKAKSWNWKDSRKKHETGRWKRKVRSGKQKRRSSNAKAATQLQQYGEWRADSRGQRMEGE